MTSAQITATISHQHSGQLQPNVVDVVVTTSMGPGRASARPDPVNPIPTLRPRRPLRPGPEHHRGPVGGLQPVQLHGSRGGGRARYHGGHPRPQAALPDQGCGVGGHPAVEHAFTIRTADKVRRHRSTADRRRRVGGGRPVDHLARWHLHRGHDRSEPFLSSYAMRSRGHRVDRRRRPPLRVHLRLVQRLPCESSGANFSFDLGTLASGQQISGSIVQNVPPSAATATAVLRVSGRGGVAQSRYDDNTADVPRTVVGATTNTTRPPATTLTRPAVSPVITSFQPDVGSG